MLSSVVSIAIKQLLEQTKTIINTKEQEKALEAALNSILYGLDIEPYYSEFTKTIDMGSLAKLLIKYCQAVPIGGQSLDKRCSQIAKGLKVQRAYQSKAEVLLYKIAYSYFYILNPTTTPDGRSIINHLNLHSATLREDIQRLEIKLSEISAALLTVKPEQVQPALRIPAFINPPYSKNNYFSNREGILDTIHQGFTSGLTTQYLSGIGGIGKTQIALEYAFRHETEYDTICWVNAETETAVLQSYQSFADTMQLLPVPKEVQTSEMIIKRVLTWLGTHENWLFIYDNIEDITSDCPWWPKCNRGNRILTTQKSHLPFGKKIEVIEFSPDEAISFLERRTQKSDPDNMKTIAKWLGYHPLALEQAAAYIVYNKDTTFADYLELLNDLGLTALEETNDKDIVDYHRSVTATMEIAIAKIELDVAHQLLYLCSYLASENIDPALFNDNAELLPNPLETYLADDLLKKRVWRALTEYSLLEFREGKKRYSIHRLLQEVVRRKIGDDQQWAQCCLELIYKVFRFKYGDVVSHTQFMKLLPHVEALLKNIELYLTDEPEQAQIAQIYDEGGFGQYYLCNYTQALEWYVKALVIKEKMLGKEHPDTVITYNNIASIYSSQGDYPKALEWYEKALTICEKVLGKEHPNTATIYNNIALVYKRQGDNPKALMWYLKDLAISEKALGKEHPGTATTYNNIAAVYQAHNDYPKALEWYEKALAIREKVLGKEHPDTAATYNNIAGVYESQGNYPKALAWFEKAVAIYEKVLGKEHPDTAGTYNNIAFVYDSQGNYPKALEWYLKAYAILKTKLGEDHPYTKSSLESIRRLQG